MSVQDAINLILYYDSLVRKYADWMDEEELVRYNQAVIIRDSVLETLRKWEANDEQ